MVIKYTNIYHSKAIQNLPKFGNFWFENKPSGNLAFYDAIQRIKELTFLLPVFSESTASRLGTASRTELVYFFEPRAGQHDLVPAALAPHSKKIKNCLPIRSDIGAQQRP
jgi:hypothetical protein